LLLAAGAISQIPAYGDIGLGLPNARPEETAKCLS